METMFQDEDCYPTSYGPSTTSPQGMWLSFKGTADILHHTYSLTHHGMACRHGFRVNSNILHLTDPLTYHRKGCTHGLRAHTDIMNVIDRLTYHRTAYIHYLMAIVDLTYLLTYHRSAGKHWFTTIPDMLHFRYPLTYQHKTFQSGFRATAEMLHIIDPLPYQRKACTHGLRASSDIPHLIAIFGCPPPVRPGTVSPYVRSTRTKRIMPRIADNVQNEENTCRSTSGSIKVELAKHVKRTQRTTPMLLGAVLSPWNIPAKRLVPLGFSLVPMGGDGRSLVGMTLSIPPRHVDMVFGANAEFLHLNYPMTSCRTACTHGLRGSTSIIFPLIDPPTCRHRAFSYHLGPFSKILHPTDAVAYHRKARRHTVGTIPDIPPLTDLPTYQHTAIRHGFRASTDVSQRVDPTTYYRMAHKHGVTARGDILHLKTP